MKKGFAVFMALLMIMVSTFISPLAVNAQNSDDAFSAINKGDGVKTYTEYKAEYADMADATSEIAIKGGSFKSAVGTVEKAAEYQGKKNVAKFINEDTSATYEFVVKEAAKYTILVTYIALDGRNNAISMGVTIDGAAPFDGLQEVEFPRLWADDGEVRVDGIGNEFSPSQKELFVYNEQYIQDPLGLENYPYCFYLTAGKHTITFSSVAEPIAIAEIKFAKPLSYASYDEVSSEYEPIAGADILKIEGESANIKTTYSLVGKSDSSDVRMSSKNGQNPYLTRVNYIGNTNWQMPGEKIVWKFSVAEAGLYKLGFRYRQNYVLNGNSYRKLYIDGKVPFEEATEMEFKYGVNWEYQEWANAEGTPYLVWLDEGEHEIAMEVTLGRMTEVVRRLEAILYDVGVTYRKIVMITGESPDANRDYALFEQIPDLEETLTRCYDELEAIAAETETLAGKSGGTNATSIRSLSNALDKMLEFPLAAHTYKSLYYTNYTSVSALVYEMMKMALSIDYIEIAPESYEFDENKADFFESSWYTFERFLSSFSANYNNISGETDAEETIDIWVNWGRDQVRVLNDLIQSSFTPQTGIGVNLKISNASYIQGILSGDPPDCSLHMARSEPVNLALRGAMYNLEQFPDFEKVMQRFYTKDASLPFEFNGGTYALPDTISYYMMFYRTDIFEEYGLKVPKTWDEYIQVSSFLMRNNLQASLPYVQLTGIAQVNQGVGAFSIFPSMLIQKGGQIYMDDCSATDLTTATALEVFKYWTDFYNEYKFPKTADFFNRFRLGIMPLGIQSYTQYINLSMAAPEISGKWAMAPIPGFKDDNGVINNSQAGSGTGCGILASAENPKGGWEFLKWWTSAETQLAYSNNCESILGVSGRVPTSNPEAFKQMGWDSDSLDALLTQWSRLKEIEEVPGGYYTARVIDQAFWNVVDNGQNSKDTLVKWAEIANKEIARKRKQYNVK